MAKSKTEKRRLIKFSNYSMCVTLPKWVIDQLDWQKGDELLLTTDLRQGKITLVKNHSAEKTIESVSSSDNKSISEAKPKTKLRW